MLNRKMLRDIKKNLSEYLTIFLMVLIGIMAYTGIESYMIGMQDSANDYYENNNLQVANLYGEFRDKDVDKVKKLKYVDNAEGKLTLLAKNESKKGHKLSLNFINTNDISRMYIVNGTKFHKNDKGIWLDSYYAKNNNIKVGDTIKLSYDKFELNEKVKGLITVPDHVYETKDATEVFPSHTDYGYAYLSIHELEKYIDKDKLTYSSIMIVGSSKNIDMIRKEIKKEYSDKVVFTKMKDELSYSNYQSEIDEGKTYVGVFSGLFIFIAILSVITTMTRTVKRERIQIGTLKALGFSDFKVTMHYISYGLILSIIGSILGMILGYNLIGKSFMDVEMSYYEIPTYHAGMASSTYLVDFIVIILIALTIFLSTKNILVKNAADVLREDGPNINKNNLDFTTKGLFKKMNFIDKWNIRDMYRNKFRTIMGLIGILGSVTLLVMALGMNDTMNNYLDLELNVINNYKNKGTISSSISDKKLDRLTIKYPNSKTYGIEVDNRGKIISTNLFINNTNGYMRILDDNLKEIKKLKNNGVYVTRKFAENNNYKLGDTIKWHIYGSDKYYKSKIVGLNFDPQNQNMTMSEEYLESLGIKYRPDTIYSDKNIKNVDGIGTIQTIESIKDGTDKMMNTMKEVLILIIVFAVILGVVIIYNMGILSFTEKEYQFATLKVLGFDDKKIGKIFKRQNFIITLIAVILGMIFGKLLLSYVIKEALSDSYDFFAKIYFSSYILAFIFTFVMSSLTSNILALKIKKIDMVKSLKASE